MYGEMDAIGASACTTIPEAADATGAAAPASSVCSSAIARVATSSPPQRK